MIGHPKDARDNFDEVGRRSSLCQKSTLSDPVEALIADLLAWIGNEKRPYLEVLNAWRTSCPRLPVWEEACDRGFIARHHDEQLGTLVTVSPAGREYLEKQHTER